MCSTESVLTFGLTLTDLTASTYFIDEMWSSAYKRTEGGLCVLKSSSL